MESIISVKRLRIQLAKEYKVLKVAFDNDAEVSFMVQLSILQVTLSSTGNSINLIFLNLEDVSKFAW